jgi:hypothetical protein
MTENQFELLIIHGGMMREGLSSDEALAAIIIMGEPAEDINWLIKRVKGEKTS